MRPLSCLVAALGASLGLAACRGEVVERRAARAPSELPSSFTVHEWGLFALDIAVPHAMTAASASPSGVAALDALEALGRSVGDTVAPAAPLPFGRGLGGGKPVIYVHLDEGVSVASFTLHLGLPRASVVEHFPGATLEDSRLVFGPVTATRGPCAAPTEPPHGDAPACWSVADGYCEAAEIPRYRGDADTCLAAAGTYSELLFYRAAGLDRTRLPLVLERDADGYAVRQRSAPGIGGPVLFVEQRADGSVRRRWLATNERDGRVPEGDGPGADDVRAALMDHARSLGLRAAEAEAFVDAWAPAYFGERRRSGPEASGFAPPSLGPASVSLLYFAPRELVDALLPLTTEPPARQVHRAFLVRIVDSERHAALFGSVGTYGMGTLGTLAHGGGTGSAPAPATTTTVGLGAITVRGGLGIDAVRRVVRRNVAQVRHCYEQGLRRNPDLAGVLGVAFVVAPTGSVATSHATTPLEGDSLVQACILGAIRRWTFPSPDPPANVLVGTTFRFGPGR